ncbi:MAG: hypothetical protein DCC67_02350 [Planctomycetota bacterium]|nr:MAG: hypothetical protein DCC67_02350 [Planctomycetota bacterium]
MASPLAATALTDLGVEKRAAAHFSSVEAVKLIDVVVRTQLRVTEGALGGLVRWHERQPFASGYFGVIRADGVVQLGWAGGEWPVLAELPTELAPAAEDVVLELRAAGAVITLSAWAATPTAAERPYVMSVADFLSPGEAVGWGGLSLQAPGRGPIEGVFRYVELLSIRLPEPPNVAPRVLALGWSVGAGRRLNPRRRPATPWSPV